MGNSLANKVMHYIVLVLVLACFEYLEYIIALCKFYSTCIMCYSTFKY